MGGDICQGSMVAQAQTGWWHIKDGEQHVEDRQQHVPGMAGGNTRDAQWHILEVDDGLLGVDGDAWCLGWA